KWPARYRDEQVGVVSDPRALDYPPGPRASWHPARRALPGDQPTPPRYAGGRLIAATVCLVPAPLNRARFEGREKAFVGMLHVEVDGCREPAAILRLDRIGPSERSAT